MAQPPPTPGHFLPCSPEEVRALGWERPDVLFVSGDAYVDHPSFAAAILGRWLEAHGFKVAILAQPDWRSAEAWRAFGPPRLFYAVSAGNMDSMINHYTANKKRRNADAYSPGGAIGLRPDRACAVYAQRCREAGKGVPVVTGGVEASLRRVAHYDYWSDKVLPSNLVSSKADLLVFGMGERNILEIAQRLDAGEEPQNLRDLRGVAYLLGGKQSLPDHCWEDGAGEGGTIALPSFAAVGEDPRAFAEATRLVHRETNPRNARRLTQAHGERTLVVNPPPLPLGSDELDALYELPYTRRPHPRYEGAGEIPAWQVIKDSVQIMRGCFGGCSFCSITLHQGRSIESRSQRSILEEVRAISQGPDFKGHVSDLGGPTANMYRMGCTRPEVEARCRRLSCVHPKVCKLLGTSHRPLVDLMRESRGVKGVRKVHIASGIRMDLAADEPEYLEELARHHVGGHLKVAPEHVSEEVLGYMKKPGPTGFERFAAGFRAASEAAGKEQYLVPYFMASHPGCGVDEMIELAVYLKRSGYRPRQVQDFIPAPMDVATCIYYTGLDPETGRRVHSARKLRERSVQRALLQFFAPENYFEVRGALRSAGREDLIGSGPDCLIPTRPPPGASEARRRAQAGGGDGAGGDRARGASVRPAGYRGAARQRGRRRPR
ncbi:MAG: YgiQ family radical SAM protein [Deltaproteobacteria bacterium]|nr:YgiQ family radical SAM protein [Deltaproteobacteria bacterium]